MILTAADVPALQRGCEVLSSGGGGSTIPAAPLLPRVLDLAGGVRVVGAAELAPDARLVTVGATGSATIMRELIPSGEEFVRAIRALERYGHQRFDAVVALEIGGCNGMFAAVAAALTGLPLVDGDTMGRAFPQLTQATLFGAVPALPMALAKPSGGVVLLDGLAETSIVDTLRDALPSLGGWAGFATFGAPVAACLPHLLHGSVSRAVSLGARLASPAGRAAATSLWSGTVIEVTRPRLSSGVAVLEGDRGGHLRIDLAGAYLWAQRDGA